MNEHGSRSVYDVSVPRGQPSAGAYGRLFPDLPPYEHEGEDNGAKTRHLEGMAKKMMEGEESTVPARFLENPSIPAGYTFFGQFVAHDLTHDPSGVHQREADPDRLRNYRTPRLDLDHVYGAGPAVQSYLYDRAEEGVSAVRNGHGEAAENRLMDFAFLIGGSKAHEDLPRTDKGRAIAADPRNDSNLILSQLHLAFLKFHNKKLEEAFGNERTEIDAFAEARRQTRWHYQWVVVHDYLPRLVGYPLVKALLPVAAGGTGEITQRLFSWSERPFLPLEFSVAAFRVGHSMIRRSYDLNAKKTNVPLFPVKGRSTDLRGNRSLPKGYRIDWSRFVKCDSGRPQPSRIFTTQLPYSLQNLPDRPREGSLAEIDLRRSHKHLLPSGQDVARALGIDPLPGRKQPLWTYLLREANELEMGLRLGPVGGRIIAEVILGLLSADSASYVRANPTWRPDRGAEYGLADFLVDAEVLQTRAILTPLRQSQGVGRSGRRRLRIETRSRT